MTLIVKSRILATIPSVALVLLATACSSSSSESADTVPARDAAPPTAAAETSPPPAAPWTPTAAPSAPQDASMSEFAARQEALRQRTQEVANHYIAVGKRHMADGRLQDARRAFANALDVQPGNEEAQGLYARVSALMGEPAATAKNEAQETWALRQAMSQQAYALAKDYMSKGHHFYSQSDYAQAVEQYQHAVLVLQANPNLDGDFNMNQVKEALADAEQKRDASARESEAARIRDVAKINADKEEGERQKVARRISRMWEQALSAFSFERFDDCERMCADIMREDPSHAPSVNMKEAARRMRHEKANATNIGEYRHNLNNALDEMKNLAIPTTADVGFPNIDRWKQITQRGPVEFRRGAVQVSEADDAVRRTLEGTTLTAVDWKDKTLDDALKFIRNNTRTNIIVTKEADTAKPPEDRQLSLTLNEISAYAALSLAVGTFPELAFVVEDGMVKVTSKEQVRKRKVVEFYEVRDLTAKIQNFPGVEINLNPSGFGAGQAPEEPADEGENKTLEGDRLIELIRATVDPTSWDEDPENSMVDKSGTLVIKQTPENQRKIRQLLSDLRKSAGIQVQIESRFISVENNFLQDIGVDFRGLGDNSGGVGRPGRGLSRPFDDFGTPGSPTVLGTDNSSGAYYNFAGNNGDIRGRTQNLFDQALGNPSVLTASGGFSLQWTYLDDTQLEAILRLVQKYERVNTVTAPKLLVYNTERANLQVTNHVAYVKDFDVEIAQAAVIADPVVDVVKEGVILDVRPIVSNDRRFVTMELRPSVATLVRPLRTFSTTLGVGTAVTFEVPELKKESLKTTVVMPDGGTLLLGGLKFYQEQDQDSGIPVLKDIPILSFFFSRKGKYTNMRDLIVLLRVKVLIMDEHEPTRSAGG